ncbi:MAG: AAA family ATPase, partial [Chloroflexi bacterium]|nr:AAA family ATPase [Chloroflexota bacterium]
FGGAGGGMLSTPPAVVPSAAERRGSARVFPFGISRSRLEQAIRGMQLPITIQEKLESSDALVTLRNYYRRKPQLLRDAEARGVPLYVLKNHTLPQIEQALHNIWQSVGGGQGNDQVVQALHEAEEAAHMVMNSNDTVALNPQNAYIRRLQHEVATRYNLTSRSNGREPNRRVMISREINGTYNPLDEEAEV